MDTLCTIVNIVDTCTHVDTAHDAGIVLSACMLTLCAACTMHTYWHCVQCMQCGHMRAVVCSVRCVVLIVDG